MKKIQLIVIAQLAALDLAGCADMDYTPVAVVHRQVDITTNN